MPEVCYYISCNKDTACTSNSTDKAKREKVANVDNIKEKKEIDE